jgi:hypothetical protein
MESLIEDSYRRVQGSVCNLQLMRLNFNEAHSLMGYDITKQISRGVVVLTILRLVRHRHGIDEDRSARDWLGLPFTGK